MPQGVSFITEDQLEDQSIRQLNDALRYVPGVSMESGEGHRDEVFIRGGSYLVTKDELTLDWRETESQDIWNETYPNLPKSLWWYRDRFDMGFRLVCDPVNIPGAK